ncbi:unnamed protein product (macronuclear) [Paramecium tetraurelia]|uniref:B box-type domain-containing protein n=1 Tax=Paramecium tetraurelia TaxID=5888 RepID=A0DYI3_PARTE|nr:uncharacterized protein GSPATT00003068001 [Paramecium tetraurelia]CAK88100.1 unnamed protein product [Paramecium tetraurelia]|eukprot:XP_001455497.1 hypothetical protein (macronuclear) [Paramecium tetraurelia strain d4-2]
MKQSHQNRMLYKLLQSKSLRSMFSPGKESIITDPNRVKEKCLKHNLKARFSYNTQQLCEICAIECAYDHQQLQHIKSGIILHPFQELKSGTAKTEFVQLSEKVKELKNCKQKQSILMQFTNQLELVQAKVQSLFEQVNVINTYGITRFQEIQIKQICKKLEYRLLELTRNRQSVSTYNYHQFQIKLNNYQDDILLMKKDIEDNLESIINKMEIVPLNEIIQKYQMKLDFYESECNQTRQLYQQILNMFYIELQRMSKQ